MAFEFALEAGERGQNALALTAEIKSDYYDVLWDSLGTVGQASVVGIALALAVGGLLRIGRAFGKTAKD